MIADKIFSFKNIAWIALLAMFFSCENATKQKEAPQGKIPYAQTEDFQLIYTDSAKVKAILTSNLSLDYSNQKFAYQEFPQGLVLDLFDEQARKNTIKSHYAIYYLPTQIVELLDSVELITHDGKILKTSQIFWQANSEWAFTEKPFTYIDSLQGSITKGIGMDFDKSFSRLKAHKITGILPIKE